jgi:hypothetical protein
MQQYLPTDDSSPYYADDFPSWPAIPWTLVDTVIYKPTAWGGCGVGPAATALIEGTFEEDEPSCYEGPDSNHSHYWNPDGGYLAGFGSANSALFDAQHHFAAALASYPADKAAAYYRLGRAAHLLADMSVPAHTLLDEHGGTTGQFDSFEDYTATGSNYKAITCLQAVTDALLDPPSAYLSQGDTNLTRLFYTLAKKSKGFDSDDANGVSIEFGSGKYNHGAGTISDSDLQTVYQPNLEARAIGFSAALYQLFWNTTHPPPVIQAAGPSFGVSSNQFGFNVIWASNRTMVVEACTNPANPIWSPLQTNTLTGDAFYFSDPRWTNYPKGLFPSLNYPQQLVLRPEF